MFTTTNGSSSRRNRQQKNNTYGALPTITGDESKDPVFEDHGSSSSAMPSEDGHHIAGIDTSSLLVLEGGADAPRNSNKHNNRGLLDGGGASHASSIRSLTVSIVESTFVFDGERALVRDFGGQATVVSEIINIAKNLIGGGALSLSGGMALYSNNPSAILSATVWIVLLGGMFGYFCVLIANLCQLTGGTTYRGIWKKTVGNRGSLAVSLSTAFKAALGNLAYASILSQTFVSLLETVNVQLSRPSCLLIITVVAILPLCLLKNLHILAPFSVLGTSGMLFTCCVMGVRYLDGSYEEGGIYYDTIPTKFQPSFGLVNESLSMAVLPFVCMVYEAYVMHYNAPRFYTELKNPTMKRFTVAVEASFGFAALIYIGIASFGFLTFGGHCSSYILNNYSTKDPLATISRLAVGVSSLTTYPIAFIGFRDGVLDVLEVPLEKQTSWNLNALTLVLLTFLTVTALFITDLGFINAVGGGTLATAVVFVFPAIMYRRAAGADNRHHENHGEVAFALALAFVGLVMGVFGVWVAIH